VKPIIPVRRKEPFDDSALLFELKLGGLPGARRHGPRADALEERQPDEAVQRRLHRPMDNGGLIGQKSM